MIGQLYKIVKLHNYFLDFKQINSIINYSLLKKQKKSFLNFRKVIFISDLIFIPINCAFQY